MLQCVNLSIDTHTIFLIYIYTYIRVSGTYHCLFKDVFEHCRCQDVSN